MNALCLHGPGALVQTSEAKSQTSARRPLYALAASWDVPLCFAMSALAVRVAIVFTKRLQSSTKAPGQASAGARLAAI